MSNRADRLNARAEDLRRMELRSQARIRNARRSLETFRESEPTALALTAEVINAKNRFYADIAILHEEVQAATDELRAIHDEQRRIVDELDRHTTRLPALALMMVEAPDGARVIERRTNGTDDRWCFLNDDEPMSFEVATGDLCTDPGGSERYRQHNFVRLYTQDEVDDLLDSLGVSDLPLRRD